LDNQIIAQHRRSMDGIVRRLPG